MDEKWPKSVKETRQQKFVRIANYRTAKVTNDIRLLSNLVSPAYVSSPSQRDKIISVLRKSIEDLEYRFGGEKTSKVNVEEVILEEDVTIDPDSGIVE